MASSERLVDLQRDDMANRVFVMAEDFVRVNTSGNEFVGADLFSLINIQATLERAYEALLGGSTSPVVDRVQYYHCHFLVTILYLFQIFVICRCLRFVNQGFTPVKLRPLLADIISTFQGIACGFENAFVRKTYGMLAYCCQTFCLGLWASWTFTENSSGNPVTNFKLFFVRKQGAAKTLLHMSCQMLAGLLAYRYARLFWTWGLSEQHTEQLNATENCVTDLNVPVVLGFMIELGACFVDTLVARTTTKRFMFERYEHFAKSIFSIWMTVMGLNLTGMYLNPANATARNFGCAGVTKVEFIAVYWMGPIVGCAIGIVVHQNFSASWRSMLAHVHGKASAGRSVGDVDQSASSARVNENQSERCERTDVAQSVLRERIEINETDKHESDVDEQSTTFSSSDKKIQ